MENILNEFVCNWLSYMNDSFTRDCCWGSNLGLACIGVLTARPSCSLMNCSKTSPTNTYINATQNMHIIFLIYALTFLYLYHLYLAIFYYGNDEVILLFILLFIVVCQFLNCPMTIVISIPLFTFFNYFLVDIAVINNYLDINVLGLLVFFSKLLKVFLHIYC